MYRIVLITTEKCMGCSVMRGNIKEALTRTVKRITFEEMDMSQVDKTFLKVNRIKDFPCMLLYRNDKLLFKYTGTAPTTFINRWIDVNYM